MDEPILIDGSEGEGGGQMLRSALTLSLLTQRPFRVVNIRANRPKPGLAAQHLASVHAAAEIGAARVTGDKLGSQDLTFEPGRVNAGDYEFRISTAGATALVLHTVYLPLLLRGQGPSQVRITGGTHVRAAPCFHFLDLTWRRYLELMGAKVELRLETPGFFPTGGGAISATIEPAKLKGLEIERGPPPSTHKFQCQVISMVAGDDSVFTRGAEAILDEQARAAEHELTSAGLRVRTEGSGIRVPGRNVGAMAGCLLPTSPVPSFHFSLGERGKRARLVGEGAARLLLDHWKAAPTAVDAHSADQILLPLAFADGPSRYPVASITQHLVTNTNVIRRFVDRPIAVSGALGESGRVEIE